jgi:hypothetical protein
MDAHVGDHIVVESRKVGGDRKSGEVIDVIGGSGGPHYRIRWDDGHESVVYPSTDAFVAERARPN